MPTRKRKVVLASRNPDKVRELREICADLPFEVLSAADFPGLPEVIEDGTTIEGNATRKALVTAAWTGEIALADDTSLQVRVLNGLPDIFAARFSGAGATYKSNVDLLLDLMQGVPDGSRQARFASACVWIDPRPGEVNGPVQAPALKRWLHNPWARAVQIKDPAAEPGFWNALMDRRQVWADYRTALMADLVAWGHDTGRAREVAAGLIDNREGGAAGAVTVPDPRIWLTHGPMSGDPPPTHVAPSGLERRGPGPGPQRGVLPADHRRGAAAGHHRAATDRRRRFRLRPGVPARGRAADPGGDGGRGQACHQPPGARVAAFVAVGAHGVRAQLVSPSAGGRSGGAAGG